MKEIGIIFKEKREEIGIKAEEAAKDMNITMPQLENLEDGNVNAFKDIFFLKDLVRKYAVYLNVDEEKIMEEFNDFVNIFIIFSSFNLLNTMFTIINVIQIRIITNMLTIYIGFNFAFCTFFLVYGDEIFFLVSISFCFSISFTFCSISETGILEVKSNTKSLNSSIIFSSSTFK